MIYYLPMAGHSKWAQIKRKKQAKDQQRGKLFSKLSREITIAVVQGGGMPDPEKNVRLRMAVEKAKQMRMPKENIKRAIDRALGKSGGEVFEQVYEGFAPYGVGVLIYSLTDNRNRTTNQIRQVLEKAGGKLGIKGSVEHLFKKCAAVVVPKDRVEEDSLFEFAQAVEADDINQDDQDYILLFPLEKMTAGKRKLEQMGLVDIVPELYYNPEITVALDDKKKDVIEGVVESLEELEDVQKVFHNAV